MAPNANVRSTLKASAAKQSKKITSPNHVTSSKSKRDTPIRTPIRTSMKTPMDLPRTPKQKQEAVAVGGVTGVTGVAGNSAQTGRRRKPLPELGSKKEQPNPEMKSIMRGVKHTNRRWIHKPGHPNFNQLAGFILKKAGKGGIPGRKLNYRYVCESPPLLMAHQESAAFLARPGTPIHRLLVVHRTGSGKTMTMIQILDNFFEDPRPKIAVFPNTQIRNNFYEKLFAARDTKYYKWAKQRTEELNLPFTLTNFVDVLRFKGQMNLAASEATNWKPIKKGWPGAPLRVFSYSQAGGTGVFPYRGMQPEFDRRPRYPIFHKYWDGRNAFDRKIILMDEVHNLIVPRDKDRIQTKRNLRMMRERLYLARESVVIGLTATPVVNDPSDGKKLLKVIKGVENKDVAKDTGFVSFFDSLPTGVYPKVSPDATGVETRIIEVTLQGLNLKRYLYKFKERVGTINPDNINKFPQAMPYCNMAFYSNQYENPKFLDAIKTKQGRLNVCTKFDRVVSDVFSRKEKAVVFCKLRFGFKALVKVFEAVDPQRKNKWKAIIPQAGSSEKGLPKTLIDFNNMNTNPRGEKIRILLLETDTFGEGIDLFGVRRMYFCHPALSYGKHKQWVGRVLRSCSYAKLPPGEQAVTMETYVSVLPRGRKSTKTVDGGILEMLQAQTNRLENAATRMFRRKAADKIYLNFGEGKILPENAAYFSKKFKDLEAEEAKLAEEDELLERQGNMQSGMKAAETKKQAQKKVERAASSIYNIDKKHSTPLARSRAKRAEREVSTKPTPGPPKENLTKELVQFDKDLVKDSLQDVREEKKLLQKEQKEVKLQAKKAVSKKHAKPGRVKLSNAGINAIQDAIDHEQTVHDKKKTDKPVELNRPERESVKRSHRTKGIGPKGPTEASATTVTPVVSDRSIPRTTSRKRPNKDELLMKLLVAGAKAQGWNLKDNYLVSPEAYTDRAGEFLHRLDVNTGRIDVLIKKVRSKHLRQRNKIKTIVNKRYGKK